jgi:predicted transcriptional regulator
MNGDTKVLHIGIASRGQMKARTLAIARGELKPGKNDPKVWFTSLESLAQVLSKPNQLLLEIIRRERPASLADLAALSKREESNLNRTLHTMERYGLVILTRVGHRVVPLAPYGRFSVDLDLAPSAA